MRYIDIEVFRIGAQPPPIDIVLRARRYISGGPSLFRGGPP